MGLSRVKASFYIQLQPEYPYYGTVINGAKAVRLTQNKPTDLKDGCIALRLVLDVPVEVFELLAVTAVVEIPEPAPAIDVLAEF